MAWQILVFICSRSFLPRDWTPKLCLRVWSLGLAFLNERTDMRFAAEIGLQAKILEDIEDLYLKRRDLEDRIRNVDWLNKLRIEKGALLDIEAYRADHLCPDRK
jgi:hypothetical protein